MGLVYHQDMKTDLYEEISFKPGIGKIHFSFTSAF